MPKFTALALSVALIIGTGCARKEDPVVTKFKSLGGHVGRESADFDSPIIVMYLSETKVTDSDLGELAHFKSLAHLELSYTSVTDEGLKALGDLNNLTHLNLSSTRVTSAGLSDLTRFTKLTELRLGNTRVTDDGLEALAQLKSLRSVELTGTRVTRKGVEALQQTLPNCSIIYGQLVIGQPIVPPL